MNLVYNSFNQIILPYLQYLYTALMDEANPLCVILLALTDVLRGMSVLISDH